MPAASNQFDLTSAFLDQPKVLAYGLVRGAGNLVLQQELADKTRVVFAMLGEGAWDSILRIWINRKLVTLPNTAIVHFHPGLDGEIGFGMGASSTGGDQHVDSFWSSVPGSFSTLTYSRHAWLALKVAPDAGAPSANLEVLADYQAMKCRVFDASGNQTAFQWTQNPAWWICDFLIRKFVLREAKINQPLVAAELARFDWQSFSDAAAYNDALLGAQPTFVQKIEVDRPAGSATSYAFVLPSNVQVGSLLVFAARETNVTGVTDTQGNTWVKLYNTFWYALNCAAGATTVTATFSPATHMQGIVAEYSGVGNFAPDVSADLASGTGTTATSSTISPTQSGDLILAWGNNSTTNTPAYTAGLNMTLRSTASKNVFLEDFFQAVQAPGFATVGISTSVAWNIGIVAFKGLPAGSGQKRFSDGGLVFLDGGLTADRALDQMLLLCRSYHLERNGKLSLYPDKTRSSIFTFKTDNVAPLSFAAKKSTLQQGKNQIKASWREITRASGSADDATRFAIASSEIDHEAHQLAIGARGPGLSVIPKIRKFDLDYGNNTAERVARLALFQLVRQLGDDVDPNLTYKAPWQFELTAYEDSLAVEPGDVVTIDKSLSEEFGGKLCEVLEIEERPGGARGISGLEYQANAFTDVAPTQQVVEAPAGPGTGLPVPAGASHFSYRPLINALTATDAGVSATINGAAQTVRFYTNPNSIDVQYNSVAITALAYKTTYFVDLVDDDLGNLGPKTVTLRAWTTREQATGTFIGSITTPAAADANTAGNNDGGVGAQYGGTIRRFASTIATGAGASGSVTGSNDGNWGTSGAQTKTGDITGTVFITASGFGIANEPANAYTNIKLKIKAGTASNASESSSTSSFTLKVRYSIDGGSNWTDVRSVTVPAANAGTASLVVQIDTVSIADGTDLSLIQAQVIASAGGSEGTANDGTKSVSLYETQVLADF